MCETSVPVMDGISSRGSVPLHSTVADYNEEFFMCQTSVSRIACYEADELINRCLLLFAQLGREYSVNRYLLKLHVPPKDLASPSIMH